MRWVLNPLLIGLAIKMRSQTTNLEIFQMLSVYHTSSGTNGMKKLHRGLYVWNSLPKEIRDSKSLTCFERKIASHIV
jgi:hypothetical protein